MITSKDFDARGWDVVPTFTPQAQIKQVLLDEMENHSEATGKSSWGTRNVLQAFVLSTRPKIVLEFGGHIGSASIVMGAALKANKFGRLYTLEPQEHYYTILKNFVGKAGLSDYVCPLQLFSSEFIPLGFFTEKADIIFLDANHTYSHVLKDLELCDQLIAENGLIFLDDVGPDISSRMCEEQSGGVRQALLDFSENRPDWKVILFEPPLWLNHCGLGLACKQAALL